MKIFCLFLILITCLMLETKGMEAQTTKTKLDQVELMKQLVGTWQKVGSTDTILGYEIQQYGNAFAQTNYHITKGTKFIDLQYTYTFSPQEDKFKLFGHSPDGNIRRWMASFTAENMFYLDELQNFKTRKILRKHEVILDNPTSFQIAIFSPDGVKIETSKWSKVK